MRSVKDPIFSFMGIHHNKILLYIDYSKIALWCDQRCDQELSSLVARFMKTTFPHWICNFHIMITCRHCNAASFSLSFNYLFQYLLITYLLFILLTVYKQVLLTVINKVLITLDHLYSHYTRGRRVPVKITLSQYPIINDLLQYKIMKESLRKGKIK